MSTFQAHTMFSNQGLNNPSNMLRQKISTSDSTKSRSTPLSVSVATITNNGNYDFSVTPLTITDLAVSTVII